MFKHLLLLWAAIAMPVFAQNQGGGITQPGAAQRSVVNPTTLACTVGVSPSLLYKNGNVDSVYTAQGDPCAYALAPGGSTTVCGGAVGGTCSSLVINGGANGLVKATSAGAATTPAVPNSDFLPPASPAMTGTPTLNATPLGPYVVTPTVTGDGTLNAGTGALAVSKIAGQAPGTLFPINTGTVVAGPTGSAVVGLQTVDGVNNATIGGAVTAAILAGGNAVSIPATYPCTEQFISVTGIHVFSARPCDHTSFDVREFGATGNGANVTGCTGTSGLLLLTCSGHPFVLSDMGRVIGLSVTGANVFLTTISSVSGGVATLANALPATLAGTQNTWLVTDDTAAFDAWNAYLNAHPGSTGTIQNGWYWFSHAYYFTQDVLIQGQGPGTTHLTNASINKDWFIFDAATSGQSGIQGIKDLSFYGLGNHTTGNMVIQAHPNFFVDNVAFSGSAGRAILGAAEAGHYHGIVSQLMRQTITNPDNVAWNESYIDNFRISNPGLSFNTVFGNGGVWNWNINSVGGVFPASGAILQDDHCSIDIANTANFHISNGTIKPLTGICAVKNRGAVGEFVLDSTYIEFFTGSAASPTFIYGGPRETAAFSAGITTSALQIPLVAGQTTCGVVNCTGAMWFPGYIGDPADIALVSASSPGSIPFSTVYPPDFLSGSASASSIGGGILRGDFEQVRMQAMVNDTGGFSAYIITGGRGLNGTTAKAWPAGAVFQQSITENFGAVATLTNNRLLASNHDSTTWPISQNTDLGQTKGAVLVGQTPDLFHVPGGPNALTGNRQVSFGFGNFIGIPTTGMYAVEAATAAGIVSSASGNQASPCATTDYIFMSGFGLNANRDYYTAGGVGALLSYFDPTMETPISISGANTNPPRGTCSSQGNVSGSITGNIKTFFGTYTTQDDPDPTTGQSLDRFSVVGNRATLPGLEQDIWTGSAWLPVWQNYCTVSQTAPWCNQKLQMGNGLFTLISTGSDTTMTFPGADSSHANIITTAGSGPLDFIDKTHCFLDHSGQLRNNGTCVIGLPAVPMNSVAATSIDTKPVLTSALPSCVATTGTPWRASVTDATAPALGSALTGGGTVFANVHCSLTSGTYLVDGL